MLRHHDHETTSQEGHIRREREKVKATLNSGVFIPSFLIFWDHRAFCRRALFSALVPHNNSKVIGGGDKSNAILWIFQRIGLRHYHGRQGTRRLTHDQKGPFLDFVLNFVFLLLLLFGSLFRDRGHRIVPHYGFAALVLVSSLDITQKEFFSMCTRSRTIWMSKNNHTVLSSVLILSG